MFQWQISMGLVGQVGLVEHFNYDWGHCLVSLYLNFQTKPNVQVCRPWPTKEIKYNPLLYTYISCSYNVVPNAL